MLCYLITAFIKHYFTFSKKEVFEGRHRIKYIGEIQSKTCIKHNQIETGQYMIHQRLTNWQIIDHINLDDIHGELCNYKKYK